MKENKINERFVILGLLTLMVLGIGALYLVKGDLNFQGEKKKATGIEQRLEELKTLRDKGLITEEEYTKTRQRLLDKLVDDSGAQKITEPEKPVDDSGAQKIAEPEKPFEKSGAHGATADITVTWEIISETPMGPKDGCPVLYNDKIYYVGGHNGNYGNRGGKRDLVVFDPYTDRWERLASMPYYRGESGGRVIAANDMLYVFGGGDPPGHGHRPYILQYNPAADSWTQDVAVFPYAVGGIAGSAVVSYEGLVYSFSGVGNKPGVNYKRKEFFTFDPLTYDLEKAGTVPHPASWQRAYVVGDSIWLVGGVYGKETFPIDVYHPGSNTWKASRAAPPIRGIIERAGQRIFLFSSDISVAYVYDDTGDSWLRISSHPPRLPGYVSMGSLISFDGALYSKWGQNSAPNKSLYVLKGVPGRGGTSDSGPDDDEPKDILEPGKEIREGVFSAAVVTVEGRRLTRPGKGGVVKNRDAAWDGNFSTYVEAESNGDGFIAIVWETTEDYLLPRGAADIRVHAKVEHRHWQSHAGVYAYDFEKGEFKVLIGGEKSAEGILEETVALSPNFIEDGKVRLRALLFAKHGRTAYARYYGAEVLYTKTGKTPGKYGRNLPPRIDCIRGMPPAALRGPGGGSPILLP